jgi:acetaldehyde dehydrogenase
LERDDIALVFDATSAAAHRESGPLLVAAGKRVIDLTPAALGPYVVPAVNFDDYWNAPNVNLISCGGQATIPFVHAVDRVAGVTYAEIVAAIASASAGIGTRQNIDEFTETTRRGLELVGGADSAKAIIVLNPAVPPITMRDTIFSRVERHAPDEIESSVREMAGELQKYVPGVTVQMLEVHENIVTIMIEIEGAGDYLPPYAGNLDIMTSAAANTGERIARRILETVA